jgi:hypothetical protein
MIYAFTQDYRDHTSLFIRKITAEGVCDDVEIHGPVKIKIAIAVINNYRMKLGILERIAHPVILIEAPEDELLEALKGLQMLGPLRSSAPDVKRLLENPSLESLKNFVAVRTAVDR